MAYNGGAMRSCAMHYRIKLAHTLLAHDVQHVLVAGGFLPTAPATKHKKIKAKGGEFELLT